MPKVHTHLGNLTGAVKRLAKPRHPMWPTLYLHRRLRDRDKRDAIRLFQHRLKERGFQRQKKLEVDGVVGPLTWDVFWEALITKP